MIVWQVAQKCCNYKKQQLCVRNLSFIRMSEMKSRWRRQKKSCYLSSILTWYFWNEWKWDGILAFLSFFTLAACISSNLEMSTSINGFLAYFFSNSRSLVWLLRQRKVVLHKYLSKCFEVTSNSFPTWRRTERNVTRRHLNLTSYYFFPLKVDMETTTAKKQTNRDDVQHTLVDIMIAESCKLSLWFYISPKLDNNIHSLQLSCGTMGASLSYGWVRSEKVGRHCTGKLKAS